MINISSTNPALLLFAAALIFVVTVLLVSLRLHSSAGQRRRTELSLGERLRELDRISDRLNELHTVFVTPHLRGGAGETLLEELIKNWLPAESYRFQYGFKSGARADAVIRLGSYLVAVDAKFPLESVQAAFLPREGTESGGAAETTGATGDTPLPSSVRRALLNHAKTISDKYIRPDEGTLQFALMYLPSEAVYYRCFVRESGLAEELLRLNVIPTGPYALFLYIQTVAYGLRGFAFPKRARELTELSYRLRAEVEALSSDLSTAGTHLKNLGGSFDAVGKRGRNLRELSDRLGRSAEEAEE